MLRLALSDPAGPRALIVAALIAVLPIPYVLLGRSHAPFARDLAERPDLFRGREAVLVLNRVSQLGRGWAELGEPGGTVRVEADPRFGLAKDEHVNVKVAERSGRYVVVEVSRHATRRGKWAVSLPALLLVSALCVLGVRVDRARRALRLAPTPPAHA